MLGIGFLVFAFLAYFLSSKPKQKNKKEDNDNADDSIEGMRMRSPRALHQPTPFI